MRNIQIFADKEICWRFRDEITSGENLGFQVGYEGEDLTLEEERIESLSMVTYNIMSDWKNATNMMCWTHGFYSNTNI